MMKTCIKIIDGHHASYAPPLTEALIRQILPSLKKTTEMSEAILGGRRKMLSMDINEMGPIVVKSYARGGILSFFVKETYLRLGKIRSLGEFEWLDRAKDLDIPVPNPLACLWKGKLFYQCWLIMENIGPNRTLAQISLSDEDLAKQLLPAIREKIFLLVHHNILHVDLHPGNILLNDQNHPFIIDFDKARFYRGSKENLIEKYIGRWKRSVRKHHLPLILNEVFE
jgi:3-deoxy-D-manno-octulosonic acid kinase